MTYIEDILICFAIPMFLSLFFTKGNTRTYTIFVIMGIRMCLPSIYVNNFFIGLCRADTMITAIEITPLCEEVTKLLPLLFFILIFEPDKKDLPAAVIMIVVDFATSKSVCYLTESEAGNFSLLPVHRCSADASHSLYGIFIGYSVSCGFSNLWLTLTGTVGILGVCIGSHVIYNLLIAAMGIWRSAEYFLSSVLIIILFVVKGLLPKLMASVK